MSRSRKKTPMQSICGGSSAKYDKQLASRGYRHAIRQSLRVSRAEDFEDSFLLPHRLECSHNQVYSWNRDGHQVWMGLTNKHYAEYLIDLCYDDQWSDTWPPAWYLSMMRK